MKSNYVNYLALPILFSLVLSACTPMQGNVSQVHVKGPSAKLVAENGGPFGTVQVWGDGERCTDPIAGAWVEPGGSQSMVIPAGKPISIARSYGAGINPHTSCQVVLTFTASAGKTYRSRFSSAGEKCFAEIAEESEGPSTWTPVSVRKRNPKTPMVASAGFCE